MTKTSREADREHTEELYEKFGDMARFTGLCVSAVDQEHQEYDDEFLEWHGFHEVAGTNNNFAGVLIDEDTTVLIDLDQEKIIETDHTGIIAMAYELRREHDEKKCAQIMALYQRLVNDLLKQQFRAAG